MAFCSPHKIAAPTVAMLVPLLIALIQFASSPSPTNAAPTVPAAFVFGDSLADVGNNNYIDWSLLKANFPYNGIDYLEGKATGRFSNGKNSVDLLAEKLGLPSPPPYLFLKQGSDGGADAYMKGVSFASGGSGVLNTTNAGKCITMDQQIDDYSAMYGAIVQQLGSTDAQALLSRSIFAVVTGSNDLLGNFKSQRAVPTEQLVATMAATFEQQLKRLYNLGARKLMVVGTGPVGCTPSQRTKTAGGECNADANLLSREYSESVSAALERMKSDGELGEMSYSFFNSTLTLLEIIQNPADYGFTEAKAACCGLGGQFNADVPCIPISNYCDNRTEHVFWDFYHPTEATARVLSNTAFDGTPPHVFPINVKQLAAL